MTTLLALNTPVFAVEGVLHLNRADYRLKVNGLLDSPKNFTLDQLKTLLPTTTINCRLTSVSGWSVRANWTGILWRDFISYIKPPDTARYCLFTSAGDYTTAVWMNDLSQSTAMLVWGVDGEPLENQYGGPLRILVPNLWGYKSCKWVTSIEFMEKYTTGYWELRGYTHRGLIEPGETFDVNAQKYRTIEGGEVTSF